MGPQEQAKHLSARLWPRSSAFTLVAGTDCQSVFEHMSMQARAFIMTEKQQLWLA